MSIKQTRQGEVEDYITTTTGYNFPKLNQESVDFAWDFINKILPNKSIQNYVLDILSKSLSGHGNHDEKFNIFTGTGANGKSVLIDVMTRLLGGYAATLAPSRLVENKFADDSRPDPGLVKLNGKRLISIEEPPVTQKLSTSQVKRYCSAAFSPRLFHSNENLTFKLTGLLVMNANKTPMADDPTDGGYLERLRIVEFTSKFVDDESQVNVEEHRYLKDLSMRLQCKQEKLRDGLLHIVLDRYTPGMQIETPIEVTLSTKQDSLDGGKAVEFFTKALVHKPEMVDGTSFGFRALHLFDAYKRYMVPRGVEVKQSHFKQDIENYIRVKNLPGTGFASKKVVFDVLDDNAKNRLNSVVFGYELAADFLV